MKKNLVFAAYSLLLFILVFLGCKNPNPSGNNPKVPLFSFAFLTDIHLQPERDAINGFNKAIERVNKLNPDFVVTGGDLIMDALGVSFERADSLYTIYDSMLQLFHMPVYNTLGNHEVFGLYEKSGISPDHPAYGKKMYEKYLGQRYYSFDYSNWHFMVLDNIGYTPQREYIGEVDSVQMEWIKLDLATLDSATNIVIVAHIPFVTTFLQYYIDPLEPNGPGLVVTNGKEVLELFEGKNLKLVLQGHTHILEDVYIDGIHFLTGGAVSARWWTGPNYGNLEEGFLILKMFEDRFHWRYIDYGWEVKNNEKPKKQ